MRKMTEQIIKGTEEEADQGGENKKFNARGEKAKSVAKALAKRWFIDAFSGMAYGLFATLIAGTIFEQIAKIFGDTAFSAYLMLFAKFAKTAMGAGIGAGIAYALKCNKLVIFSCIVAGMAGAFSNVFPAYLGAVGKFALGIPGNPVSAYVAALAAAEIGNLVQGKTKLDIIVVPLSCFAASCFMVWALCPAVNWLILEIGVGITAAVDWSPFFMGVVIAVVMGLLLTLPTSSAAIWVALSSPIFALNPNNYEMLLAGGAAVVGCAAHMVGFAVMSFKENGISGLISQGLGTSMLQIPNLMKNPKILIPPIVASAIVGPLSTCVFKLKCGTSGGGMGTSGLVGVIDTIAKSTDIKVVSLVLGIIFCMFVIPAVVCYFLTLLLKKINWIKENDLKLPKI